MLLSVERPIVGAFAVLIPGAMLRHRNGLVTESHRRRLNMCERTIEVPQELARSCRFLSELPAGDTGLTTPGLSGALVHWGAKERVNAEVPPNEGNEVRRDGRQEVIAP